ncbi:MAG TPA: hypothetical protein VIS72_11600 [Anaerolineales bacterium]
MGLFNHKGHKEHKGIYGGRKDERHLHQHASAGGKEVESGEWEVVKKTVKLAKV